MAVKKQTRNNDRLSLSNNSSLEKSLERIVHKSQQHRCYREMQMISVFRAFPPFTFDVAANNPNVKMNQTKR